MDKKSVLAAFFLFVAFAGVISDNLKGELDESEGTYVLYKLTNKLEMEREAVWRGWGKD